MPPILTSISPHSAMASNGTGGSFTMIVTGSQFGSASTVVFGGTEASTVVGNSNVLYATIEPQMYANFSLGGATVYVRDGNLTSNSTLFEVTAPSPLNMADLLAITKAINIPSLDALTSSSEFIQIVPYVDVYRVLDGDTMQGVAQRQMGDAAGWQDIAFINNLRYPYISSDPNVTRGDTVYKLVLSRPTKSGDTTVYINAPSKLLTVGSVLLMLMESPLSDGSSRVTSDVVVVADIIVDQQVLSNTKVRLESPVFGIYPAGHIVDVVNVAQNTSSRVVAPGDFILIPASHKNNSFVYSNKLDVSRVYEVLGQDIRLDDDGYINADDNGDFETVAGLDNLHQALVHRLMAEQRELNYHPNYGNPLIDYIGSVNNDTLAILANYEIQNILLQDPRVSKIKDVSTVVGGDTIQIRVVVDIDLLNTSTEFNFVLPKA